MGKFVVGAIGLVMAAVVGVATASACSCPKEQMIKKYGTVSQIRPLPPLPPPLPPGKSVTPTAGG
jgi:hypothetical protein